MQGSKAAGAAGIAAAEGEDPLEPLVHRLPFQMKFPCGLRRVAAGIQPHPQGFRQGRMPLLIMLKDA